MKAVIQRVSRAKVTVSDQVVGEISKGLVVLLGITHSDSSKESKWLAEKIATLRIFSDPQGKMNLSVLDCGADVLIVSQFTLYANAQSGRRPDFLQAADPKIAEPLYREFICNMQDILGKKVATGIFGAAMSVELVNDGPVTLVLENAGDKQCKQ